MKLIFATIFGLLAVLFLGVGLIAVFMTKYPRETIPMVPLLCILSLHCLLMSLQRFGFKWAEDKLILIKKRTLKLFFYFVLVETFVIFLAQTIPL
jgi:hypothetical protein